MVPLQSRQILSITLPTIAIFLSYLWFRRKRIGGQSDPGESSRQTSPRRSEKTLAEELEEAALQEVQSQAGSPNKSFNRSLSGVETAPIDIIIPPNLRSQRTSPVNMSDEDLDLHIEQVILEKSTLEPYSISKATDTFDGPSSSSTPVTGEQQPSTMVKSAKKQCSAKPKQQQSAGKGKSAKKVGKKDGVKFESKFAEKQQGTVEERRSCDRDSANHSPMDASSSLSSISDSHSEGSSDSGKGGSDVTSGDISGLQIVHEFLIPQALVGKLIGRYGFGICDIKDKSHTKIVVRKHPTTHKFKICTIEGCQDDVDKALSLIRNKFPIKRYPDITLEHVIIVTDPVEIPSPEHLYLKLVEGVNNDTVICSVVAPDHLFVHQPTHPTFPCLQVLNRCMNNCYNSRQRPAPKLSTPIPDNTVCVAYSNGEWHRAMVLSSDPKTETSYVTFLDLGGYYSIANKYLKQIRGDMLLLPFQSAECYLYNIRPVDDEWSEEALRLVKDQVKGTLSLTQVADYSEDGVPLVLMYILVGHQKVIFLNDELVKRGFAKYITSPECVDVKEEVVVAEEEELEGAVGGVLS
ncbi:PREDICTED: A-kinase anchor protein 1, mitochondrial [Nicrophorus vespilloides]|uniref:A-kinase anchor protein 1, mitochondrial n=1 Tax=Nicrophorus vespilloides TaxID=110193 RepID=A0ABM1M7E4_NICVS|nr:PREDICTED: A-kinase anchor protein 1, mitochondrial [Nicrophorus vespilloides]